MATFTGSNEIEIKEENGIVKITGVVKIPKFNKYALYIFFPLVYIYIIYVAFIEKPGYYPLELGLFALSAATVGLLLGFWVSRKANKSSLGALEINIDKANKTLNIPKEGLNLSFDEVIDVEVGEKQTLFKSVNNIKLVLKNGQKTLAFPITNYNEGSKIVSTIKTSLGL